MHLVFSKKSKGNLTGADAAAGAGAGPDLPSAPELTALPTAASPSPADWPDELSELDEPNSKRSSILACAPPAQDTIHQV